MRNRNPQYRNGKSGAATLRMEHLEDKNLMAGDVAVNVIGNSLMVRGDVEANGVQIVSAAEDGQFIVRGMDAGGAATTINGGDEPLVVEDVDRIYIRLGAGDDQLRMPQLSLRGSMRVSMGAGDDVVRIGDGDAEDAAVDVGRTLSISLGGGNDQAGIVRTHAGRLHLTAGAGDDSVRIRDSLVDRSLRVAGRTGDDDIELRNVLSRSIGIHGGRGSDEVSVRDTQTRKLAVGLGAGDDSLLVADSAVRRAAFRGSQGTDSLATDLAMEDYRARGFEIVNGEA